MPDAVPRVLLLCGGRSEEHEVSLASAASVLGAAADRAAWHPRVIARDGRVLGEAASRRSLDAGRSDGIADDDAAPDLPCAVEQARRAGVDVVFPLLHGPNGEDGSVQGLLEVAGLPFVGSGVAGSAVSMDKLLMKHVFAAHGLPQTAFEGVTRATWRDEPAHVRERLERLPRPWFVKPANLGSSVGVRRVDDPATLPAALEEALALDRRVIVERAVDGREVEVALLGNDDPTVSDPGEIRFEGGFYDYETKYTEGRAELLIPAPLAPAVRERARELARRAFLAVDAAGLARLDLFVRPDGEVLVNEINTVPGFTRTSMYPKLMGAAGVPYPDLVTRLLALAREER